jgi:hypothetical protein
MIYILSLLVSFGAVTLKGFQHKNVIGSHLKAVFFTSYFMAVFDVAAVAIVVQGGWSVAFTAGTGAAFGMLFAIKLHDKLFKRVLA